MREFLATSKGIELAMPDRVVVTVHDDQLDHVEEVADQLRGAGMRIDQVLGEIGVITGSLPEDRRAAVLSMPGIAAVENETTFQVPPPDSEIQ